jgi:hypothetical protein
MLPSCQETTRLGSDPVEEIGAAKQQKGCRNQFDKISANDKVIQIERGE